VWGYAIVWALLNDRHKLLAYKVLIRRPRICSDDGCTIPELP
jgi:hypothetical protein